MLVLRLLPLDFILFVLNKSGNFKDSYGHHRCCNIDLTNWQRFTTFKIKNITMRVTDVIPQKTANAIQRVWMSYFVRFPRWSHHSQLKVINLILTEIAILEIYSTYLTYRFLSTKNSASSVLYSKGNKLCLKVLFFSVRESELRLLMISFFCSSTVSFTPSPLMPPFWN